MKSLKLLASAVSLALVCVSCVCGGSNASTRKSFPDNAFKEVPREYFNVCDKGGVVKTFKYTTRDNQTPGSKEFEKSALVYLPYGYDEKDASTCYNVLYLMHGGGDSPAWYLGGGRRTDAADRRCVPCGWRRPGGTPLRPRQDRHAIWRA